ncbi:pyridoxamine 5'-phosphate oxidase family protein [Pseudonocardia endophytica]|uniref:Pyridoxamine 5'-phosphate oxidase N-terminal domain-containing protein n=1 Tax=Pseudonocardia endophytica TaxID=401976 RepID=A0A4R1HLJ6_PSEEN|nr:pyridoxamine 5'-phosphate oxidase family protein [Pseudonocardia endophytica]TCK21180.1 hypothetical protein EV378_5159 [Pseudonocardia endophytica]
MSRFAQLAYTDTVRALQHENGSDRANRIGTEPEPDDLLGEPERRFLSTRDGFHLASVGETGWPYIQFRGGPPGFVHVLDEHRFAFADVRGNRQYVTTGNLRTDDRVAAFFMDHPTRTRVKLLGRAQVVPAIEGDPLTERLTAPRTDGRVERLIVVRVEGVAWNCRQHITPRWSADELDEVWGRLTDRVTELEAENAMLRERLLAG